ESLRNGTFKYINTDGSTVALSPQDIANTIDPLGLGPNPNSLAHMQNYPLPNDDTVGDGLNRRGYRFVAPVTLNWNTYIARLDYYVDQAAKHQLFLRGNYQDDDQSTLPQFDGGVPRFATLTTSKGLAVGYNTTFSPNLFSSFRYGFTREAVNKAGASQEARVEFRRLSDLVPLTRSLIRTLPVHTFREDMNWIKGSHQLKFGGVMRYIGNGRSNYANSYHRAVINGSWMVGSGALTPDDTADYFQRNGSDAMALLLGTVSQGEAKYNYLLDGSVQPAGSPVLRDFAQENYEFYFMDTWRISRGLTLTAGLRWHLHPPVHETNGYQTSSVPNL
ncbi:MAG: hypothetical protein GY953_12425, partial [bacterium]|nr:hypothetical protein [bacterium]